MSIEYDYKTGIHLSIEIWLQNCDRIWLQNWDTLEYRIWVYRIWLQNWDTLEYRIWLQKWDTLEIEYNYKNRMEYMSTQLGYSLESVGKKLSLKTLIVCI